jgi:hypothetical protein
MEKECTKQQNQISGHFHRLLLHFLCKHLLLVMRHPLSTEQEESPDGSDAMGQP